ncbi:hypothetical protein EHS13_24170 [Paenibacillus psychroresistens]|uniref:beta-mannosidase n=1 Tax=Paenibacillus psychroresistens TaxID=1778678 RepID=A0A6B8RPZ1_9BACL|nr:glycoside hydrolase family 2 TIM barrel-domain containing protein [Paenibacillus psychroresistens]QGQ97762.1 hypothetical protein EHS13_24170 [Paenibacillus psychroresistens]
MEILLNELNWELKGYYPWVPYLQKSVETGLELNGVTHWIPATVPGGVHYDLYRAGLIPHPHQDMNSLLCEWVENRWWLYRAQLTIPEFSKHKLELVFKGLDYRATIYINNVELGKHEGMYHPAVFDITDKVSQGESITLEVLFEHAPDEVSQIGKTSMTTTQKSRFNYKWDFSTRLVNLGIWDDILLKITDKVAIGDLYLTTDVTDGGQGDIQLSVEFDTADDTLFNEYSLELQCWTPQGTLISSVTSKIDSEWKLLMNLKVDKPQLWYPNGFGEQALYKVLIKLKLQDIVIEERQMETGIRKLRYKQNIGSPKDSLPYTVEINGINIYIKGVNMTPLDLLYGNVTKEHYAWIIRLMKRAHINLVRVWGGGIIEKEWFYDLCDRNGIMVWQEFIQSSSGLENIPSKHIGFLDLLQKSANHAIKLKRNHVSLTVWSGGNELMSEPNKPSTYEDENLAMLKKIVNRLDPSRLFLPTSASGPVQYITKEKGVSHDVHGDWKYNGMSNHYELYGEADHLFHSEFGVDGASSLKSLQKFLSPAHLKPSSVRDELVWRHHGEWWDTFDRDGEFFGPVTDLNQYVQRSQWIQAEGLRFILETNRRRKFNNSGSVIWQLNEPWPNVSCTSLVEYYGDSKMAYYWTRKAFAPIHVSIDYRRLQFKVGEAMEASVILHADQICGKVTVLASVLDEKGTELYEQSFEGTPTLQTALVLGQFSYLISEGTPELFFLRLQWSVDGRSTGKNLYTFSTSLIQPYHASLGFKGGQLLIDEKETDWKTSHNESESIILSKQYTIANIGTEVALHICPIEESDLFWMEAEGAFESLFPGESQIVTVYCMYKQGGAWLKESNYEKDELIGTLPIIRFQAFGHESIKKIEVIHESFVSPLH